MNINNKTWDAKVDANRLPERLLEGIPYNISPLYKEIVLCLKARYFTATLLLMRKMIVHIAICLKDDPHESFAEYINYIQDQISLSQDCTSTLTRLRIEANHVSHEIRLASSDNILNYLHAMNEILTKNDFRDFNR